MYRFFYDPIYTVLNLQLYKNVIKTKLEMTTMEVGKIKRLMVSTYENKATKKRENRPLYASLAVI